MALFARILFTTAPFVLAYVPSELAGVKKVDDIYRILNDTTNENLHTGLPEQIRGTNLTLENLRKWFTFAEVAHGSSQINSTSVPRQLQLEDIDPSIIMNTVKSEWDIYSDGKPKLDASRDFATAVPKGSDWVGLEGWRHGEYGKRVWEIKNMFGITGCKINYSLIWSCNGMWQGKGRYVSSATQRINYDLGGGMYVNWGGSLKVKASAMDPINLGTRENPIAGLPMQVTADCCFGNCNHYEETVIVRGDCATGYGAPSMDIIV